ncbi:MAG: LysE family translocator [Candidatus Bathyarchaeota archaeon]|nr:LysE family translocator [Candidatus Bathyarchaeota archaeon]
MAFTAEFYLFLASVVLISLTGVMMPGPLFAVTIEKAAKRKTAGLLIAVGHGIVEFPLMFLIYYGITQIIASNMLQTVQVTVGISGGLLMMFMGFQTFRNRNKASEKHESPMRDSLLAGIWTTAANAGFILWWLTIGTTLVITARSFGLLEFSVFAVVHWLCDFLWYTVIAYLIFKSHRFWTRRVNQGIVLFCFAVLMGFGAWFFTSALWLLITALM